MKIIYRNH